MSPEQVGPPGQPPVAHKPLIPKKTVPLAKFIRTGEGILVFAFNLVMLVVPIVSNALTPEQAVKWAGIVNGVAVLARTGLKAVAVLAGATGNEPADVVSGPVAADADQLATALAQALPRDLAARPSIDQVGGQVDEVKGLVVQLLSDAGVTVPGAPGNSGQVVVTPGAQGGQDGAPQEVAPQDVRAPDGSATQPVQPMVSDDEEQSSAPTDADVAESIADTTSASAQPQEVGAPGPGQQAAAAPGPAQPAGGAPQPDQSLVSDDEEFADAPTDAEVAESVSDTTATPSQPPAVDGGQVSPASALQQGSVAAAIVNPSVANGGGQ